MWDQESNSMTSFNNEYEEDCYDETASCQDDVTDKNIFWSNTADQGSLNILHPDDPLMKRFQNALKAHLTRMDNKLSQDIHEIEITLKTLNKESEKESKMVHSVTIETINQRKAVQNYQSMLSNMTNLRECYQEKIEKTKKSYKKMCDELNVEKMKQSKMTREMEQLLSLQKQYAEWEKEISDDISVSKRMSEKEMVMKREMTRQKKQQDYILYKLTEEIWKLDTEKKYLHEQLLLKDKEKMAISQSLADANAELEAVQKEQKKLLNDWNNALTHIRQQNEVNEELNAKCRDMRQTLKILQSQVDKIKKDTTEEMENNEQLTALQIRVEEEIKSTVKGYELEKEKLEHLEHDLTKFTKIANHCQREYNMALSEFQSVENEENLLQKELEKLTKDKSDLEDELLTKLNETVMHDKSVHHLNKLFKNSKNKNKEEELSLLQTENTYGKNLFEIERLTSIIENDKYDLDEIIRSNIEKEKDIEKIQKALKKCEISINSKERKIMILNKKIDETLQLTGNEGMSPQDLKINLLEKNIEDIEIKNEKSQQFWLRQGGDLAILSQQRNVQLQELGLFTKQIMIIEQKNYKLEYELEKQKREETNISRKISELQKILLQRSTRLTVRKEFKNNLEDEYCLTRNDYAISLKEAEKELMQLQAEVKELEQEKITLKEQLDDVQRETFSWEKKVQLTCETSKSLKEECKAGGDIAMMKSEIHKMEIRLSHLKKAQEKLIQDMEFCITRRENIMERATAEEKKNPKGHHNRRIVFQKHLDEQRSKIKQITKETKQIEDEIIILEKEEKQLLEKWNNTQEMLREIEDVIPVIDKQIMETEIIKNYVCNTQNLEILIRKQRKVLMLQNVKSKQYKASCKSESLLNNEMYRQQTINAQLKEIMNQTKNDFPLLKNEIRKILLTLEI